MSAQPPSGRPGPAGEDGTGRSTSSELSEVRRSETALDLLAARAPLGREDDELLHLLAGWAAVVDAETEAATRVPARRARPADAARHDLAAGVRPVLPRRARRTPWWALSAGAAAVIAVMAVGLGAQDTAPPGPGTVAESVQSVEATLVAARLAAEQGDVVGARSLLERARELVAALPDGDQAGLAGALVATEEGVVAAEAAVRSGQPLPPWPDVPGLPDPAVGRDASAAPEDVPSGRPSDGGRPATGAPGQGRPDRTPTPGGPATPAPGGPTARPTATPPVEEPAPAPTTTAPVPAPTTTTLPTAPTTTPTTSPGGGSTKKPAPTATRPGSRPTVTAPPATPPRGGPTRTQGAAPTKTVTRTPPGGGGAPGGGAPGGDGAGRSSQGLSGAALAPGQDAGHGATPAPPRGRSGDAAEDPAG